MHAVLQVIDLATLAQLDELCAAAARDEALPDQLALVRRCVRDAAASRPVRAALASGRYWREVAVTVELQNGAILDGAIDLLYEQPGGQLVIVDYKTDRMSEVDFASRAESYRPLGAAYAESVRSATGKDVSHVALVFAALGGRVSEIDTSSHADGEDLPIAESDVERICALYLKRQGDGDSLRVGLSE